MKKMIVGIVAALLVVAIAVPAFAAALTDSKRKEINDLYGQIANLRKQVVQEYVDAGLITREQADQMKKGIDNATKYQQENSAVPGSVVPNGCGGGGYGMMNGYYNGTNNTDSGAVNTAVGQAI